MKKSNFRGIYNRILGVLARLLPGAETLRPYLHRRRGVRILGKVFIGEDVMLETEYPECVEIHDQVTVSMRATVIAHTRGPGKVVLEKSCFVGPHTIIVCPGDKTITVGEGAVIGAGSVITRSVPAHRYVAPPQTRVIAQVDVPLTNTVTMEEFLAGLKPLDK